MSRMAAGQGLLVPPLLFAKAKVRTPTVLDDLYSNLNLIEDVFAQSMDTKLDENRPMVMLDENTPITSSHKIHEDKFVVYKNQVALTGGRKTHERIALQTNLYYPDTEDARHGPVVDDGGKIFDNGKELVIPDCFTRTTRPRLFVESDPSAEPLSGEETRKLIRERTGQLVANITRRNVLVRYEDGSKSRLSSRIVTPLGLAVQNFYLN